MKDREELTGFFDPARREKARRYNHTKNRYEVVVRAFFITFWLAFYLWWGRPLAGWVAALGSANWLAIVILVTITLAIFAVFSSLMHYLFFYKLNREYGLVTEEPGSWWIDRFKLFIIQLILVNAGAVIFQSLYLGRERWWLYLGIIGAAFYLLFSYLFPVILLPLFYKLSPYPEDELRQRLENLLARLGVKVEEIYEINLSSKTSGGNAMVMGLGNTRKIALGDTLREVYTAGEIEAVMAHELGHHLLRHYSKQIVIFIFQLMLGLWLAARIFPWAIALWGLEQTSPFVIMAFALIYFCLNFIFQPVILYTSRVMEEEADRFALMVIKDRYDFINAMAKLGDQHLAPLEPPGWKVLFQYSHPPIAQRVQMGLAAKESGS